MFKKIKLFCIRSKSIWY